MTVHPRLLAAARVVFVVGAVAFAWWGLRDQWPDVVASVSRVPLWAAAAATGFVLAGLALTGWVWRALLVGYGHAIPRADGAAVFFVGQLGKYIPGSVWSLGAQAQMARRFHVPARTTVAVGLLFLWANIVTAASAGLGAAAVTDRAGPVPVLALVAAVLVLLALTPPPLAWLGRRLAGAPLRLEPRRCAAITGLLLVVWACYGLATRLLGGGVWSGSPAAAILLATGAFAVSYIVGVLLVFAPAGLGAREATLTFLLAPSIGVPAAAATALLTRVVHTVGDFAVAGFASLWARRARRTNEGSDPRSGDVRPSSAEVR